MKSDSTVVPLRQPDTIENPLTSILRSGARRLLAQVIEGEAEAFLTTMKGVQLPDGRDRVVRHGLGPERLFTGIGPVEVRRVKLRDRGTRERAERICFTWVKNQLPKVIDGVRFKDGIEVTTVNAKDAA